VAKNDLSASLTENLSIADRLTAITNRLAASAELLNAASDEFSKPIQELETALQKLNLGLITWQTVTSHSDDHDNYSRREVGYTKVDAKWGLVIRTISGNPHVDEGDDIELWPFSDAPRSYRIEALDKLPDLLEELIKNADKTSKKLKEKAVEARVLATALNQAAELAQQQKKERR
jgi:hypothetical protein